MVEQKDGGTGLRLANLSVQDHAPHLERYAAQGYMVDGTPGGIVVPPGLRPEDVRELARQAVRSVSEGGYSGALIGGRADVVCYLRDALGAVGLRCFAADTARILDREGYFVLMPLGLIEIVLFERRGT
jgi:hypothetical protein